MNTGQKLIKMDICFTGTLGSKLLSYRSGTGEQQVIPFAINMTHPGIEGLYDDCSGFPPKHIVNLTFDDNWNIQAGQKGITAPSYDIVENVPVSLKWDTMLVQYPPVNDAEHGK